MGKAFYAVTGLALPLAVFLIISNSVGKPGDSFSSLSAPQSPLQSTFQSIPQSPPEPEPPLIWEIEDSVGKDENLHDIFKAYGINVAQALAIEKSTKRVYNLRKLRPGHPYAIYVDMQNIVQSFVYGIDEDTFLNVTRTDKGFRALKENLVYEKRTASMGGVIKDNLVYSMDSLQLALELSDILAWDIDFTTDLRNGDTFRLVTEELWLDGKFKKYGNILFAEFVNNRQTYYAYRFEHGDETGYYDKQGKSVKRTFLKAPLSYRRISSGYTNRRFHPILKRYRPHLGVDYAAPRGTQVSVVGDGTVKFSGRKGGFGKLVIVKHPGGYETYYGHLSRISRKVRKGAKVRQGQVIGRVGSTGLSTGPHLDYRVKRNGRFVNPLRLKMPRSTRVPKKLISEFKALRGRMDETLSLEQTKGLQPKKSKGPTAPSKADKS